MEMRTEYDKLFEKNDLNKSFYENRLSELRTEINKITNDYDLFKKSSSET